MSLPEDGPIIEIGPDGVVRDVPRTVHPGDSAEPSAEPNEEKRGDGADLGLVEVPKKSRHGGARPGAGRKPAAERHATPVLDAERRIAEHLPEVIDSLMELAMGVTVEEPDGNGGVRVYKKQPHYRACQYLIDRVMGRPTDKREVTGAVAVATLGELLQQRDARQKGQRGQ